MLIPAPLDHSNICVHSPWSFDEHRRAVDGATSSAERWNRNQRRFADIAFFVGAAAIATTVLNRDALPSWGVTSLVLIGAFAAWFALRAGARVRSVGCMVQEWAIDAGADVLAPEEILELERQSCECPVVFARIREWRAAGCDLRQREHDVVVAALRERGVAATPRSREISDAAFAEAI